MASRMDKKIMMLTSMCDNTARISIPGIFSLFMDMASEHGAAIKLGTNDLSPKGLFWLTVKTKIHIVKRPELLTTITASSWPEEPGRMRCNRYYVLHDNGETLVEGKSEWAIISVDTGRLCKLSEVYPGDIEHCKDIVCPEPFFRISEDFEGAEVLGTYTVKSTDIDLGQHMNNAAYIRALFGAFSCSETEEMNISDVEMHFKTPCYEGEELTFLCRREENILDIGMMKADGKTAAICRIMSGK